MIKAVNIVSFYPREIADLGVTIKLLFDPDPGSRITVTYNYCNSNSLICINMYQNRSAFLASFPVFLSHHYIFTWTNLTDWNLKCLFITDGFKSEAYDNWFKEGPITTVYKDDIKEYIFKEVTGATYSDDDCAGESFRIENPQWLKLICWIPKIKFIHSHLYNLFQGYSTCIYSIKLNYVIFVQPYAPCTTLRTHPACFMLAWIIRRLVRWGTYSTAADLWVWEEIPKLTWGLTWVSTSTISCAWR